MPRRNSNRSIAHSNRWVCIVAHFCSSRLRDQQCMLNWFISCGTKRVTGCSRPYLLFTIHVSWAALAQRGSLIVAEYGRVTANRIRFCKWASLKLGLAGTNALLDSDNFKFKKHIYIFLETFPVQFSCLVAWSFWHLLRESHLRHS